MSVVSTLRHTTCSCWAYSICHILCYLLDLELLQYTLSIALLFGLLHMSSIMLHCVLLCVSHVLHCMFCYCICCILCCMLGYLVELVRFNTFGDGGGYCNPSLPPLLIPQVHLACSECETSSSGSQFSVYSLLGPCYLDVSCDIIGIQSCNSCHSDCNIELPCNL